MDRLTVGGNIIENGTTSTGSRPPGRSEQGRPPIGDSTYRALPYAS